MRIASAECGWLLRSLVTFIFVLSIGPVWASDITGEARVVDGDTIEIANQRIRLFGIDAPEAAQTCRTEGREWNCGQEATSGLAYEIGQHQVTCQERDRDKYGRIVAVCFVDPYDLGARMVFLGWALAYRQYSNDYVDQENVAKNARTGVWRGEFVPPWEWRRGNRLAQPESPNVTAECLIKGNIASDGERIYHPPDGAHYGRTKIDPSKGERMFCSEDKARAAGWRKSKR